jgi:hypothetical protein
MILGTMQRAVRTPPHIAVWATLFDKGIPYLEKAIRLGEEREHCTLAVIDIERGGANKALPEFTRYEMPSARTARSRPRVSRPSATGACGRDCSAF